MIIDYEFLKSSVIIKIIFICSNIVYGDNMYRLCFLFLFCVILVESVFSSEKADDVNSGTETVHLLLDRCRESLDVMHYSQLISSVVIKPIYRKWPTNERHEVETTYFFTLKRNHEFLQIDGKCTTVHENQTDVQIFNHTINRDISVRYGTNEEHTKQGGTVSENLKKERIFCAQGIAYAFWLDGYIGFTGDSNITEHLLNEETAVIAGNETIDNHKCILISAQTPYGNFRLWLDPSAGYLFRKIENHKRQKDKGKPRSDDAFSDVVFILDDIVIEQIQGKFVITQGCLRWEGTDPLGRIGGEQYFVTRSQIELNPSFNSNSFAINLPEGIDIINLDDKDSGVAYVWDGKKAVPGYTYLEGKATMGSPAARILRLIFIFSGIILIIIWAFLKFGKKNKI
jgi:hypothetical protein